MVGAIGGGSAQLVASPIYRAISEPDPPLDLFQSAEVRPVGPAKTAMERSLAAIRRHAGAGTTYDDDGLVASRVVADLAGTGYWGLRVGVDYGGSGASLGAWAPFLTEVAAVDPWVAGLCSPHAALGPVNLVGAFGDEEQRRRLLPPLARGERLGVFAVTEPHTASDWAALRTSAVRRGDMLLLTGEKLFISNAAPGRTAAVACQLDGRLTMLIVELPTVEDDRFRVAGYDLRAPRHIANRALIFRGLPVPVANVLDADGRVVAHHGLNHGRVLIGAFAAGLLRTMAGTLIPWVQTRRTFGAPIGDRELVRRRLGRLAARIVGCDALLSWSAQLVDQGYRGELECVAAKVFASEAVKEAGVDLLLKTYGSRALLPGNVFADSVYDLLAPTVYEGENEILTLGSFASLAKARLAHQGADRPPGSRPQVEPSLELADLTTMALAMLRDSGAELDLAVRSDGPTLVDRQAAAVELAQRIQQATAMLVIAQYGLRHTDPLVQDAATCMAAELAQRLSGRRPTLAYHNLLTGLGAAVAEDRFAPVAVAIRPPVPMAEHVPIPTWTA